MTNGLGDELRQWEQCKTQAESGELTMDPEIAQQMGKNCENLLHELHDIKDKMKDLGHLSGYGSLPSALAMKAKFETKAVGGAPHDPRDNAVTRIEEAIRIAELQRDTYVAVVNRIKQTDEQTGQQLGNQGQGLR